eukprot:COSAG05_NODE_95_length_19507_cov_71.031791_14_plen_178_part_00
MGATATPFRQAQRKSVSVPRYFGQGLWFWHSLENPNTLVVVAVRLRNSRRRPGSAGYVDRGLGDTSFTALIAPTAVAACNTLVQYNALRQYESAGAVTSGNADNNAADVAASISAAWQSSAVAPSAISYVPAAARPSRGGRSRSLGATAADGVANNNRPTAKGWVDKQGTVRRTFIF